MENSDIQNHSKCLNCGTKLYQGNYCHMCGQPVNTGRLTTMNMGVNILSGITRINSKFLFTLRALVFTPWKLIARYIGGKRASYTAPVSLLIILLFIWIAIPSFIGDKPETFASRFGDRVFLGGDGFFVTAINGIFRYIVSSETLIFVLLLFPAIPVVKLTHRLVGIRKFNIAEYIVASIYISCFILATTLILFIPRFLTERIANYHGLAFSFIEFIVVITMLSLSLYKSFGSSSKKTFAKISYIFLCIILCMVLYLLLFTLVIIAHQLSFGL